MLFEDEEKIVEEELENSENEEKEAASDEEIREIEDGIVAGLTDVDTVGLVQESFLDYAMSVIVARAIPDVRDGMKPVHRRIVYSMSESGNTPDKPFKSAHVSSVTLWVNITLTAMLLSMVLWLD